MIFFSLPFILATNFLMTIDTATARATLRLEGPMIMERIASLHNHLWTLLNSHLHYQKDIRTLLTNPDILSVDIHKFPIQTNIHLLHRLVGCIPLLMRKISEHTFLIKAVTPSRLRVI